MQTADYGVNYKPDMNKPVKTLYVNRNSLARGAFITFTCLKSGMQIG